MVTILVTILGGVFLLSVAGNVFLLLRNEALMRRLTNGPWCKDYYGEQAVRAERRGKPEQAERIAALSQEEVEPPNLADRTNEAI